MRILFIADKDSFPCHEILSDISYAILIGEISDTYLKNLTTLFSTSKVIVKHVKSRCDCLNLSELLGTKSMTYPKIIVSTKPPLATVFDLSYNAINETQLFDTMRKSSVDLWIHGGILESVQTKYQNTYFLGMYGWTILDFSSKDKIIQASQYPYLTSMYLKQPSKLSFFSRLLKFIR